MPVQSLLCDPAARASLFLSSNPAKRFCREVCDDNKAKPPLFRERSLGNVSALHRRTNAHPALGWRIIRSPRLAAVPMTTSLPRQKLWRAQTEITEFVRITLNDFKDIEQVRQDVAAKAS
jgi:hypothetical protein